MLRRLKPVSNSTNTLHAARRGATVTVFAGPLQCHPTQRKADHRILASSAMALTRRMAVAISSANPVAFEQYPATQTRPSSPTWRVEHPAV